jgi:penicillin-binding protein 1A
MILLRALYALFLLLLILAGGLVVAGIGASYYSAPGLPAVDTLREVQFQVPMRVFTRDGRLLAEFGEKRRVPLSWDDMPPTLIDAFLAAEDDRFFEHPGVDYQGLARAAASLALTGERRQGGGTITMQVARNFFLTPEKTIARKIREIFLALRIEKELDKQEILTLYMNKIFLGQRSYGVGAASEVYFGKSARDLELHEAATIAGLPKAPSSDNPVTSPQRALNRRAYVLRRMLETGKIDQEAYDDALAAPMVSRIFGPTLEVEAPYVAEMARQAMVDRYGAEDAYTAGYRVVTSIDSRLQNAANEALREGLIAYDRRHGYRGPLARGVEMPADPAEAGGILDAYSAPVWYRAALVTAVEDQAASIWLPGEETARIEWDGLAWAKAYVDDDRQGPDPKSAGDVVAVGDVVLVDPPRGESGWRLAQAPQVQGAIVALDPRDGAIAALVGGFEFAGSKYNRATQARRQPGSSFKPFIYSAALENGFTTASIINDAPVVFEDSALETAWRPENYSGRFYGPTRLREALVRSRNLVSIRVLNQMGIRSAMAHIANFGFPADMLPRDLSLALGSGAVTPLELAAGYSIFANGGFSTTPYFLDRIESFEGELLYQSEHVIACAACADEMARDEARSDARISGEEPEEPFAVDPELPPQAISRQNAWLVSDMMRDVIRRGTGRRAMQLGRKDLAGKTGTTNEGRDAWFSGFNGDLVVTTWVGFDQDHPLGRGEEGSRTALPIWVEFMRSALADAPERFESEPGGLVTVRISGETGLLARAGETDAMFETFRVGHVPEASPEPLDLQLGAETIQPAEDEEEQPEETLF